MLADGIALWWTLEQGEMLTLHDNKRSTNSQLVSAVESILQMPQ